MVRCFLRRPWPLVKLRREETGARTVSISSLFGSGRRKVGRLFSGANEPTKSSQYWLAVHRGKDIHFLIALWSLRARRWYLSLHPGPESASGSRKDRRKDGPVRLLACPEGHPGYTTLLSPPAPQSFPNHPSLAARAISANRPLWTACPSNSKYLDVLHSNFPKAWHSGYQRSSSAFVRMKALGKKKSALSPFFGNFLPHGTLRSRP